MELRCPTAWPSTVILPDQRVKPAKLRTASRCPLPSMPAKPTISPGMTDMLSPLNRQPLAFSTAKTAGPLPWRTPGLAGNSASSSRPTMRLTMWRSVTVALS